MRQKVKQHKDTGGVMAIALVAVVLYSFWGASLLHTTETRADISSGSQQVAEKTLAVK